MALTNSGFDGTVTEAAWANMSALTDVDAVESSAAWAVTQGMGRQVSTAAQSGFAFAKGVLSKDTAAILTSLSTPVNGQWFLIVRHIVWSTNVVTVSAVAHDATTTTVPTVAPTTFPTIDNSPGVLYDQKLAWAWVRSTDTTVALFDLRKLTAETRVAVLEADTDWITPTLLNGWTAAGGYKVGYRKLRGVVYSRGQVTGGTGQSIFILPSGFRLAETMRLFVRSASSASVSIGMQVFPDGTVQADGAYSGISPNVAGIPPFIAEQ